MKIDVIIPVYNQERYLAAAINSVLGQCCLNKIYVIDAGSNDSSAQIAKSFAPTVELISSSKQINAAQARNLGVAQSSSELIAFLDADDLWKTDKLKKQIEALKQQGNNALIFSELEQFKSEELPEEVAAKLHIPEDTSRGYHVGTLLCHRKTFDSVGNFREDLSYSEFIDWFLRATDLNIAHHIVPEILMRRRIHQTNTGITRKEDRQQLLGVLRNSLERKKKNKKNDS